MSAVMPSQPARQQKTIYGFLSYAREDDKEYELINFISKIEHYVNDELRGDNLKICYDKPNIQYGQDFWSEIKDLIAKSSIYFVVLSSQFCNSEFCMREFKCIKEGLAKKQIYFITLQGDVIDENILNYGVLRGINYIHRFDLPKPNDRKKPSDSLRNSYRVDHLANLHKFASDIAYVINKEITESINGENEIIVDTPDKPKKPFPRRHILTTAVLGTAGLAVAGKKLFTSPPPSPPPAVEWKMGNRFSQDVRNGTSAYGCRYIADLINEMSEGQFKITLDDSSNDNLLDLVHEGTVIQCAYLPSYHYTQEGKEALIFGTTVPFGLNTQQQLSWLHHSYSDETMTNERERTNEDFPPGIKKDSMLTVMQKLCMDLDLNVIPFAAGGTGGQMGGWFKREIPEDIINFVEYANILPNKKFRFRIAGLGGEIIKQGSDNIEINDKYIGVEIADALNRGKLDAAEWIGPFEDLSIKLHNASGAKYYYYPGWWDPGTIYELYVNLKAWNELPKPFKTILKTACQQACSSIHAYYDEKNIKALKDIRGMDGIKVRSFPPKLIENMQKQTTKYLNEKFLHHNKEHVRFLYKEWVTFKNEIEHWHSLVDTRITKKHNF